MTQESEDPFDHPCSPEEIERTGVDVRQPYGIPLPTRCTMMTPGEEEASWEDYFAELAEVRKDELDGNWTEQ